MSESAKWSSSPSMEEVESKYRQELPRDAPPEPRPEFYKGVRVRMPEDYNFSHKGAASFTQRLTGKTTKRTIG